MRDRTLERLVYLAGFLAIGHHVDHLIRGNAVGWPVTSEVNGFTASLLIYPIILAGLVLYRTGRVGPGFWVFVSGGGAVFIAAIHFGPWAVEPPHDIIDQYDSPLLGWIAFGWLIALVVVLAFSTVYEARSWLRRRRAAADSPAPGEVRTGR